MSWTSLIRRNWGFRSIPRVRLVHTETENIRTRPLVIGIRREDPSRIWERRVPLTPEDVRDIIKSFRNEQRGIDLEIHIQPCSRRIFTNEQYSAVGAKVTDDLSDAHVVIGIKEPRVQDVLVDAVGVPGTLSSSSGSIAKCPRTYMMFSHTAKGQEYNMPLLNLFLSSGSGSNSSYPTLLDYELLTSSSNPGKRTLAFGFHAGLAGTLLSFHTLGIYQLTTLGVATPFLYTPLPQSMGSVEELRAAFRDVGNMIRDSGGTGEGLGPCVIGVTGTGNVANGCLSMLSELPIENVLVSELEDLVVRRKLRGEDVSLDKVYVVHVKPEDHFVKRALISESSSPITNSDASLSQIAPSTTYSRSDYYSHPSSYTSIFSTFIAPYLTLLLNGTGWAPGFPRLIGKEALGDCVKRIKDIEREIGRREGRFGVVGDISCDPYGGLEFLTHSTTLDNPYYKIDAPVPSSSLNSESDSSYPIYIQAVDILPASLPLDASIHFSKGLKRYLEGVLRRYVGLAAVKTNDAEAESDVNNIVKEEEEIKETEEALSRATIASSGKLAGRFGDMKGDGSLGQKVQAWRDRVSSSRVQSDGSDHEAGAEARGRGSSVSSSNDSEAATSVETALHSLTGAQRVVHKLNLQKDLDDEIGSDDIEGVRTHSLFVKNLDRKIGDNEFMKAFAKFGQVLSARTFHNPDGRNYGYVRYQNVDQASDAIAHMNGVVLGSGPEARPIWVEAHVPKSLRRPNASEDSESNTIWHVNQRTSEDEEDGEIHNDNPLSKSSAFSEPEPGSPAVVDSGPTKRKSILLLGSGMVAGPAVRYITERIFEAGNLRLIIASKEQAELDALEAGLESLWPRNFRGGTAQDILSFLRQIRSTRSKFVKIDVGDAVMKMKMSEAGTEDSEGEGLKKLVRSVDVVVSLLPASLHVPIAELCIQEGKHLVTASYISPEMKALNERALAAEVLLLNEIGLDPGIDHVSAISMLERLKSEKKDVKSFISFCGGLPAPELVGPISKRERKNLNGKKGVKTSGAGHTYGSAGPLSYKFSWSPRGVLTAALNGARFRLREKEVVVPGPGIAATTGTVEASGGDMGGALLKSAFPSVDLASASEHDGELAAITGMLEGLPNRDSLPYEHVYGLSKDGDEGVRSVLRGTLRYKGFSSLMSSFHAMGMLETEATITIDSGSDRDLERAWYTVFEKARRLRQQRYPLPELPEMPDLSTPTTTDAPQDLVYVEAVKWLLNTETGTPIASSESNDSNTRENPNSKWIGLPPLPASPTTPLDLFTQLLAHKLRYAPEERDMVVLVHEVITSSAESLSEAEREEEIHTSSLVIYGSQSPNGDYESAMARSVGIPVAIAALAVIDGAVSPLRSDKEKKVTIRGVHGPGHESIRERVLQGMKDAGIGMREGVRRVKRVDSNANGQKGYACASTGVNVASLESSLVVRYTGA
ncbi:Saccharopine dehydrogenase-domain-containing protein [Rhodocollybia butyracea]|uniref:Saccharopine dehydrogenase-domain-containing protein n=1 Tax=Rhodocollybia butyracea TaxID=206335 RepID=A0A9P5U5L1_9AGAR|nr:Saccharopine dehydrogenase-domain-containing protein [Rhodocollybia butyracea]